MLGFLLYLDTIAFIPYIFVFVVALYAFVLRRSQWLVVVRDNRNYLLVFALFLFLCTINTIIHGLNGIPNMYMQLFTLIIAFSLNRDDAKFFILFTVIECFVGFYEYYIGVSSILGIVDDVLLEESDLLYYNRVFGLCTNSSVFSIKLLVSLILLHSIKPYNKKEILIIFVIVLFLGLFVTFNRTVIITCIFFYVLIWFSNIFRNNKSFKYKIPVILFSVVLILFVIGVIVSCFGDIIMFQFSRDGDDSSSILTGRTFIWASFGKFISENILFGNGSVHLLVPYTSGLIHAHNSFIQLLADHGIILATIYCLNIFLRIKKDKWVVFLTFIIASLTQYVLFWGFSANDVFFFALLFNPYFGLKITNGNVGV